MSIKMEYVRVYDYNKEKDRLRKGCEEAKKYGTASRSIDNISEEVLLIGKITGIEGQPTGKLGFPTFTMLSNDNV